MCDIEQLLSEVESSNALSIALGDTVEENAGEEFEERPEDNDLLAEVMFNMKSNDVSIIWEILGINCSAHTLQLAIKDALVKLPEIHQQVIELCRSVTKYLRKSTTIHELKDDQINYSLPHLEVETRWGSMFMMVSICLFISYCNLIL